MTIYSTRFGAGSIAGGASSIVFTAPAGKTTVLRCISFTPTGSGGANMLCNLNGVAIIAGVNSTVQWLSSVFNLRAVLNAGDSIQMQSLSGAFEYFLSGYVLTP